MSQEKVDRYKEEKKNRAKNMKRAKIKKVLIILLVAIVLGAAIGIPLGRWIYDYKQNHVKEEDVFISSHDYDSWFDNFWVENYSDFYTGASLASEDTSEEPTEEASSENSSATETASTSDTTEAASTTEAPATEDAGSVQ